MSLHVFYGGTFDPIHNGHLATARSARDTLDADVRLMPTSDPPHRSPPGAIALHRARMLDIAVAGEPGLKVDRRELARDGHSYSIDTLREIRAELGTQVPVALLVGADSFLGLPEWKAWRELFDLAHFIVAERPGSPLEQGVPEPLSQWLAGRWTDDGAALRTASGRVLRLRQPLHDASATDIRRRIAACDPDWRAHVPAAVAGYIERHGLYAARVDTRAPL